MSKWRAGISRLQSARFSFDVKTCISLFVRGLPLISAFIALRADLPERIATMPDQDLGCFVAITEKVLQLDTIFRSASQIQGPRGTSLSEISGLPYKADKAGNRFSCL